MAISINDLASEVEIYDQTVSFDVEVNGEEMEIKYYPYFKPTKINELIEELIWFYQKAKEEGIEIQDKRFPEIVMFFILRHFTDLQFGEPKNAERLFKEFNIVVNSALFKFFSEEAFLSSSVKDVFEKVNDVVKNNEILSAQMQTIVDVNKEVTDEFNK